MYSKYINKMYNDADGTKEYKMYSKYISTLILDYRKLAYKSFLDKHGVEAVALAKKMSERQKHEQIKDNQIRGII